MVMVCSPIRPPGGQEPVEGREVGVPVALADRLEHLDRADRIELAVDVTVVAQFHADPAGQPGLGDPAGGQRLLLLGDGDAAHRGAPARGPDGQLAPAGADLEHPAARPHPTPARSSSRSILRRCAAARSPATGVPSGPVGKIAEE
jgi:hypothetical protein